MTREDVLKALAICSDDTGNRCHECPIFSERNCGRMLKNWALYYLGQESQKKLETQAKDSDQRNPAPDLIGEIINHYKKPFVTIAINISEDEK